MSSRRYRPSLIGLFENPNEERKEPEKSRTLNSIQDRLIKERSNFGSDTDLLYSQPKNFSGPSGFKKNAIDIDDKWVNKIEQHKRLVQSQQKRRIKELFRRDLEFFDLYKVTYEGNYERKFPYKELYEKYKGTYTVLLSINTEEDIVKLSPLLGFTGEEANSEQSATTSGEITTDQKVSLSEQDEQKEELNKTPESSPKKSPKETEKKVEEAEDVSPGITEEESETDEDAENNKETEEEQKDSEENEKEEENLGVRRATSFGVLPKRMDSQYIRKNIPGFQSQIELAESLLPKPPVMLEDAEFCRRALEDPKIREELDRIQQKVRLRNEQFVLLTAAKRKVFGCDEFKTVRWNDKSTAQLIELFGSFERAEEVRNFNTMKKQRTIERLKLQMKELSKENIAISHHFKFCEEILKRATDGLQIEDLLKKFRLAIVKNGQEWLAEVKAEIEKENKKKKENEERIKRERKEQKEKEVAKAFSDLRSLLAVDATASLHKPKEQFSFSDLEKLVLETTEFMEKDTDGKVLEQEKRKEQMREEQRKKIRGSVEFERKQEDELSNKLKGMFRPVLKKRLSSGNMRQKVSKSNTTKKPVKNEIVSGCD
eukprot:CAMPEP_0174250788 /NCGR_PEP_ID=MMETSP0439-20130205/846_1 /TAXON_ID=0 /ORGANISM="Stereomyxa ramosa, Strain Chinc5" /LENGTH=599 /DNA_ID=CAMNT_0015330945 /DNA_START=24 /DNA_END=1823 /DNA_ORIENTATION=+